MVAVIIIACLFIITSVIHIIMGFIGENKYPAPGKIAEFDDTKIHVFSKGKKEDSTKPCVVILHDTADFAPALKHYDLIKKLSEKCRTVILERAGSGWSGDTFSERTAENIVFEYRKALYDTKLGSKKYIIVAFGNSALYAESWKNSFPDEIYQMIYAGENVKRFNNFWEAAVKPLLIAVARELGLLRIFGLIFKNKISSDNDNNNKKIYVDFFGARSMSPAVRAEIAFLSHNLTLEKAVECFDTTVESSDKIFDAVAYQTGDEFEIEEPKADECEAEKPEIENPVVVDECKNEENKTDECDIDD